MENDWMSRVVLIVEDSDNAATTLEIALSIIPGISVLRAFSGQEALEILASRGTAVEAIVTDLNMPRMDGFEMIRRIREDRRFCATPIIVVSGDTDPTIPERMARLGVNAFFSKPYSPVQVRRELEHILDGTIR
jgi:CheY-like chemotaxis protein